jgi:hypothetical protein
MRRLPKPSVTAVDTFLLCVEGWPDEALRGQLRAVAPDVEAAAAAYEIAAVGVALHTIPSTRGIGAHVTTENMKDLYKQKFAAPKSPGRSIYNKLRSASPHNLCPLCGQREVSQLDHHLNQASFPALVLTPANLIPICGDCNKAKLSHRPATQEEQTLHPYYDDLGSDRWLCAIVLEGDAPALAFRVEPPAAWSPLLAKRTKKHLSVLRLDAFYRTQAAQELINIRARLVTLFEKAGAAGVRDHLAEEATSREAGWRNSWQTAMYYALAESSWFCLGGFKGIPAATLAA